MAKGRTLWEMMTAPKPKVEGTGPYDPLNGAPGAHVSLDVLDHRDDLWLIESMSSWDQIINGSHHPMADYVLASDGKRRLLRVLPDAKPPLITVLLLEQYFPEDGWGVMPYSDDTQLILEALNDPTGELDRYPNESTKETYWRIGGKVPIYAIAAGQDYLSNPKAVITLWDFWRKTTDEGGTEFTQFMYAQLSGKYVSPKEIVGGDKTLVMYRGFEIEPTKVTIYGGPK